MSKMIGKFVTGHVSGQSEETIRQGIVIGETDGKLEIEGESGANYIFDPNIVVVNDRDLWGSTAEFVARRRHELELPVYVNGNPSL